MHSYFSLSELTFSNPYVDDLPADPNPQNYVRQIEHAAYSLIDVIKGTPARDPSLMSFSGLCAKDCFGLQGTLNQDGTGFPDQDTFKLLCGMKQIQNTKPFAMCYGGYQFGKWMGQMGDGRGVNLGTAYNPKTKEAWDLQLKGGGKTPYSRVQDGQAAVRSSIRQYLCCQAMHALGVPTPRALSLIATGRTIKRDMYYTSDVITEPGAIVCRVAKSFIRFGHFELAFKRGDLSLLRALADFVIKYHYHEQVKQSPTVNKYLVLLRQVIAKTASMVAKWQSLGFVHGVMNTDNMSIIGITLDYGPFGFLNKFDPHYTPNTYDEKKRYTFSNQPHMAVWDLNSLAQVLSPLIEKSPQELQSEEVSKFKDEYEELYSEEMRKKFGFTKWIPQTDKPLLNQLFDLMEEIGADYTNTFRNLAKLEENSDLEKLKIPPTTESQKGKWKIWIQQYIKRLSLPEEWNDSQKRVELMNQTNPKYILRNYLAQEAIEKAEQGDGGKHTNILLGILRNPFDEQNQLSEYSKDTPSCHYTKGVYLTSCQT